MLARPQRKHGPKAEMNVVPYIDVMLVLLVIFMVTAPMLTQGVKIELPKVASEALVNDSQQKILTLSVKAEGGYYWNLGSELDSKNQTSALKSCRPRSGRWWRKTATPRCISAPTMKRAMAVWSKPWRLCSRAASLTWGW